MVHYLAIRGGAPGPLFTLPNNQSLTRATFSTALNKAFQELHIILPSLIHTVSELVPLHQLNVLALVTLI